MRLRRAVLPKAVSCFFGGGADSCSMSFSVSADGCDVSEKREHNMNNANPEEKCDSRVAWPFSVVAQSRE